MGLSCCHPTSNTDLATQQKDPLKTLLSPLTCPTTDSGTQKKESFCCRYRAHYRPEDTEQDPPGELLLPPS